MSEIDAPDIAKDYYGRPKAAKLRDVIIAARQDEQGHSDTNHEMTDAEPRSLLAMLQLA